jgi:AAA15 family ATPase/GTPase
MLNDILIENFKSIHSQSLDLGKVNVFIGANGSGKSNLIEAIGMLAAGRSSDLTPEGLINRGLRVAMPSLTVNSFNGRKPKDTIKFTYNVASQSRNISRIDTFTHDSEDVFSEWQYLSTLTSHKPAVSSPESEKLLNEAVINDYLNSSQAKVTAEAAKSFIDNDEFSKVIKKAVDKLLSAPLKFIEEFVIYSLNTQSLRGLANESNKRPLGLYGEGLDLLFANLDEEEMKLLNSLTYLITWLDKILLYPNDEPKYTGHKLGRSTSKLYFSDKYMRKNNNVFSAENSNEGALHILFYLLLFISKKTPRFFAIDNIENGLNPGMCRVLITQLINLAKLRDKQVFITTHSPALLDGINIHDEDVRLFEVYRNDDGHTKARVIRTKKQVTADDGTSLKLSEMWMRGFLGARDTAF